MPVAVNLYKVRATKDAGGELFRSIQRQKDQYQGIWIVSPEGKVLAGHHDVKNHKTWTQEVLDTVHSGLKTFGPITPRKAKRTDPLPLRGQGVQSDGSVTLEIYVRQMLGGGRESARSGVPASRLWLWDGKLRTDGPVVIDRLTLPAKQWSAFAPPKIEPGTEWSVPEEVARQFCRVLIPSSDQARCRGRKTPSRLGSRPCWNPSKTTVPEFDSPAPGKPCTFKKATPSAAPRRRNCRRHRRL